MHMNGNINNQYKCLFFLAILQAFMALAPILLKDKIITMPVGIMSIGSLVGAFYWIMSDIIAEIYGFKIFMKVLWSTLIAGLVFSAICHFMIGLPSPPTWNYQNSFNLVLGPLFY